MTAARQSPEWDDTTEAEGFFYDIPPVATIDRLIEYYVAQGASDLRLADSLVEQGHAVAAQANRRRANGYRITVTCLRALKERHCTPETEFRGHLEAKARPKAQVRAPP